MKGLATVFSVNYTASRYFFAMIVCYLYDAKRSEWRRIPSWSPRKTRYQRKPKPIKVSLCARRSTHCDELAASPEWCANLSP